jgi:hypothetical protein
MTEAINHARHHDVFGHDLTGPGRAFAFMCDADCSTQRDGMQCYCRPAVLPTIVPHMKSRRQFVTTLAVALTVPAAWVARGRAVLPQVRPRVPGRCRLSCGHCQRPRCLPRPPRAAAEPAPAAPVAATPLAAQSLISARPGSWNRWPASSDGNEGMAAMALLLGRQAAALAHGGGGGGDWPADWRSPTAGCRSRCASGTRSARSASGKGKRLHAVRQLRGRGPGADRAQPVLPRSATATGTVRRLITKEQRRRRIRRGGSVAGWALLRTLRYTDLGGMWVPLRGVGEAGSATQTGRPARQSLGQYCPGCHGFGMSGCEECQRRRPDRVYRRRLRDGPGVRARTAAGKRQAPPPPRIRTAPFSRAAAPANRPAW